MRLDGLIVLCLLMSLSLMAQEVLTEKKIPAYYEKVVLVPEERFVEDNLTLLGQGFLEQHADARLARLLIVTDKKAGSVLRMTTNHRNYASWVMSYFGRNWRSWGMAEVFRIQGNAVMRIRYPDGKVVRKVLRGQDPLRLRLAPDRVEIIYVAVWEGDDSGRVGRPPKFFVVTSRELSRDVCKSIVGLIRERTGLMRGEVAIGNDPWFITDSEMPARYQLWDEWLPPDAVEFIESPTALSGWGPGGEIEPCSITYPTRPPKYCESVMYGGGHRE